MQLTTPKTQIRLESVPGTNQYRAKRVNVSPCYTPFLITSLNGCVELRLFYIFETYNEVLHLLSEHM